MNLALAKRNFIKSDEYEENSGWYQVTSECCREVVNGGKIEGEIRSLVNARNIRPE